MSIKVLMINKQIYNRMKKLMLMIVLGLVLSTNSVYAVGANSLQPRATNLAQREVKIASRAAVVTQVQANISQDLRNRAQTEITRRLDFLNDLVTKLNGIKKLSSAEKADLQSQIQTQIDGLNTLQTKISGDTDNTTLRADVKSIVSDYYIFLFFRVKVNLLISADKAVTTADNLIAIDNKLKTRIDQAQLSFSDAMPLNSLRSDLEAKITDANTQINAAQTELTPLTAQSYPGNKAALADARSKIKNSADDLKTAYKDATQIGNDLKNLKIKNPEATSSAR